VKSAQRTYFIPFNYHHTATAETCLLHEGSNIRIDVTARYNRSGAGMEDVSPLSVLRIALPVVSLVTHYRRLKQTRIQT